MPNSLRSRINKLAYQGKLSKEDAERIRDALKLKKELIEEIPTFEHILNAQYEIFNKYDLSGSHTDVELIAWNENGRIMQDIQWLLDRLKECEIPKAEYGGDDNRD